MKKIKKYINQNKSIITGNQNLEHLYTFKDFPVFMGCCLEENSNNDLVADMIWKIDPETGIIQLTKLVPLDILYMEQHVDATGPTWSEYNNTFAEYIFKKKLGNIIEIGGGSGKIAKIVLEKNKNIKYTVIEPNPLFEETNNLKIIPEFFSKKLKDKFSDNNLTIVFSQVYEHVYDPEEFLIEINKFLPIGGRLIFAYPNLEFWFKNKFTNALNFEHTLLMTDYFVDYFIKKSGFNILEKIKYKNHSHFYTVQKTGSTVGIVNIDNRYDYYKSMFHEFINHHLKMVKELNNLIEKSESQIFLFGAHIFSQYLIAFGLKTNNILFILDNSPLKIEKRLYGTNLKVKSPKILTEYQDPSVILKTGLYNEEIKNDIIKNINSKTNFI